MLTTEDRFGLLYFHLSVTAKHLDFDLDLTSRVIEVCSDAPNFLVSLSAIAKHLGTAHGQVTVPIYRSCRNGDN